jgi:Cu-processing system permease protein
MRRVVAIAQNTFRETIRDRILGVIVLFALVMILGSLWLASVSLEQGARMMKDFGLVAVSGFGLVVTVFVAASLVRKEVEKRTVFVLFSKPVGRGEFIWGKFFGLSATMAAVMAGMGVFLFGVSWSVAGEAAPSLLLGVALVYVQLVVVMAVTVFFSTMTSAVLATVLGICTYVAGVLSANVLILSQPSVKTGVPDTPLLHVVTWPVYLLVPNLSALDIRGVIVEGGAIPWSSVAAWAGYLVAYTVVVLLAASAVFRRKEF